LGLLARNLTPRGVAVIMVSAGTGESINDTYETLRSEFSLKRVRVAAPRIARRLPSSLVQAAGRVLLPVKPAWVRNLYVLTK
jgi:hypothetical protein